jgi:hypothetical protein
MLTPVFRPTAGEIVARIRKTSATTQVPTAK